MAPDLVDPAPRPDQARLISLDRAGFASQPGRLGSADSKSTSSSSGAVWAHPARHTHMRITPSATREQVEGTTQGANSSGLSPLHSAKFDLQPFSSMHASHPGEVTPVIMEFMQASMQNS